MLEQTPECQRALTLLCSRTVPAPPLARSLDRNRIRDKGATALAAILNQTQITDLRCAAALKVFAFLSTPIDTLLSHRSLPLARSLGGNVIGVKGATELAAILNKTKITSLKCAATRSVCSSVNAH